MAPRTKRIRKVVNPPPVKGFKPYGPDVNADNAEIVRMLTEEYESMRLCDYDKMNHEAAALAMGVSRPTFTRIYASARQKLAKALAEGLQISIEGGKVYFDSDWFSCSGCGCYFNHPEKDLAVGSCPLCHHEKVVACDQNPSDEENAARSC